MFDSPLKFIAVLAMASSSSLTAKEHNVKELLRLLAHEDVLRFNTKTLINNSCIVLIQV